MQAPELMRCATLERTHATKAVDVFSFGVLLLVIRTKRPPYHKQNLSNFDIIDGVRNHGLRPTIPASSGVRGTPLEELIVDCVREEPGERPTFKQVIRRLSDPRLLKQRSIGAAGTADEENADAESHSYMKDAEQDC